MRFLKWLFVGAVAAAVATLSSGGAFAGPVFLTGHDPDFHSQAGFGSGANLLEVGLNFATSGNANTFSGKVLWIESKGSIPGGHLRGADGLNAIGLAAGTDYDWVDAAEFTALMNSDISAYSAIGVASSFGGTLRRAELDALISRSDDIKAFINAGGLFASSECFPCGGNLLAGGTAPDLFGYLPIDVTSVGANAPFTPTAFGLSLGLTAADLNDPTHNSFGETGGLNVVDLDSAGRATTLAGIVMIDDGGFIPVPEAPVLGLLASGAVSLFAFGRINRRKSHR